jgi:hypothetical protein
LGRLLLPPVAAHKVQEFKQNFVKLADNAPLRLRNNVRFIEAVNAAAAAAGHSIRGWEVESVAAEGEAVEEVLAEGGAAAAISPAEVLGDGEGGQADSLQQKHIRRRLVPKGSTEQPAVALREEEHRDSQNNSNAEEGGGGRKRSRSWSAAGGHTGGSLLQAPAAVKAASVRMGQISADFLGGCGEGVVWIPWVTKSVTRLWPAQVSESYYLNIFSLDTCLFPILVSGGSTLQSADMRNKIQF